MSREITMVTSEKYRREQTPNPWALIFAGAFVWLFSSLIIVGLFKSVLPHKEWADIYTTGAKLIQLASLTIFILASGIRISDAVRAWAAQWRHHLRLVVKYYLLYAATAMTVIGALLAIALIFEHTGKIDASIMDAAAGTQSSDNSQSLLLLFKSSLPRFLLALATTCIIAPVIEEIFFRKLLFVALRLRMNIAWSLVITAILFSLVHSNILLGAIGGIYLGYIYEREHSLPANIMIHSAVNFTVTVLAMLSSRT